MKIIYFAIDILLIFGVIGCEQGVDQKVESEILLQTDRNFAALSADSGAATAFGHYMAQNAMQMPDGSIPILGRDSIYASLQPFDGKYTLTWQPQTAEVARSGDMGWTWGIYKGIYRDSLDSLHVSHGKYLNVWVKQPDGQWRVRVDIGNKNQRTSK